MDAWVEPGVETIVFLKPVQVAFSEGSRNIMGFSVDLDPGPMQLVMPNQQSAEEAIKERIRPLLTGVPRLARHLSSDRSDNTLNAIHLDTMSIFTGWATSAQSLASRPIRYLILDEVDKYPASTGEEADPISLAIERTTTFLHRRRILIGSTPTTRRGPIWIAWEACGDHRYFHVPCPHCGRHQALKWDQVQWPELQISDRKKQAEAIQLGDLAWYECVHCKGQIKERHKPMIMQAGLWVSTGQTVEDGKLVGERPKVKQVGFFLNSLYSPWKTFSACVAMYLNAIGDRKKMQNFRNSWLAEPFEEQITVTKADVLFERVKDSPAAKIIPPWAGRLLMTADVQLDHYYWVLRAWGHAYRSRLIDLGVVYQLDHLKSQFDLGIYPIEGTEHLVKAEYLFVDSGYRKDDVYMLCAENPAQLIPVKGNAQPQASPIRHTRTNFNGVLLRTIDHEYYSDRLASLMQDPEEWEMHKEATLDYCRQVTAEHKILDRSGKEIWVPVTTGAANHFRDCEKYQAAGADLANVHLLPAPQALEAQLAATVQASDRGGFNPLINYKGKY